MRKNRIAALLALLTLALLAVPAHAYTAPSLEGKDGSITITIKGEEAGQEDAYPLRGVEVTLYQIASAQVENGKLVYYASEGLERFEPEMNGKLNASASRRLARMLALDKGLSGNAVDTKTTSRFGKVRFDDLAPGLYLAVQTAPNQGFNDVEPFLLFLPQMNEETGRWDFNVDANPKTEPGKPGDPPPPDPEEPDEPEDPEEEPPDPGIPTGPGDPDTDLGDEDPPTGGKLPQTGLTRWPVTALAVAGMLLFSLGWVLDRRERRDEEKD